MLIIVALAYLWSLIFRSVFQLSFLELYGVA